MRETQQALADHEQPAYICDEDNLGDIHDILTAALAGNDLHVLPRRWNQELGIIRSRLLNKHDAALIAQAIAEDRKLRPRPPCEECNWQERLEKEKAQAREDVLDELAQMYANVPEQFLEGTYRLHSEWKEKIESLRHGQEQGREPE